MNTYPVWMDCDVGVDDAVALMLAHAENEIDLLGISAVCGNAPLECTYWNAHRLNGLFGSSYPIYRGAEKPLLRELHCSPAFHGENGLGDVELPIPENAVCPDVPAWDALYAAAKENAGQLRLIATGPLTNVAIAIAKYPDLPQLLHSVLIMGGSASHGNVTPAAEFNIYVDPEAAARVFQAGVPIVMCGLDVTMKADLRPADLDMLAASGSRAGWYAKAFLQKPWATVQTLGLPGVPVHDACPVMYLLQPELFTARPAGVYVETQSTLTLGKTVTDLDSDRKFEKQNALVVLNVDRDRMIKRLCKAILSI